MIGTYFNTRTDIEWKILEFFNNMSSSITNFIFFLISEFGTGEIVFGLIVFIYYVLDKNLAKKLSFILGTSFLINGMLKSLFLAKRPFQFEGKEYLKTFEGSSDGATGTSFPSGHSQNSGTLYTLLFLNLKKI